MTNEISRAVAANIRRLRKLRGWSGKALVSRLAELGCDFISYDVIYLLETRTTTRITVDHAVWLARAFEIPLQTLIEPADCERCQGQPPAGFTCNDCGVTE